MANDTPLTPVQTRKIEIATELFSHVAEDRAKTTAFKNQLTDYTHAHPSWSITDSAGRIFDRVIGAPKLDKDDIHSPDFVKQVMQNDYVQSLKGAFSADPRLKAMASAEAIRRDSHREEVMSHTHVPSDMIDGAIQRIDTKSPLTRTPVETATPSGKTEYYTRDDVEAMALSKSVTSLLHSTNGDARIQATMDLSNPFDDANQRRARVEIARKVITTDLKSHGVSDPQQADVDSIINVAQDIARNRNPDVKIPAKNIPGR